MHKVQPADCPAGLLRSQRCLGLVITACRPAPGVLTRVVDRGGERPASCDTPDVVQGSMGAADEMRGVRGACYGGDSGLLRMRSPSGREAVGGSRDERWPGAGPGCGPGRRRGARVGRPRAAVFRERRHQRRLPGRRRQRSSAAPAPPPDRPDHGRGGQRLGRRGTYRCGRGQLLSSPARLLSSPARLLCSAARRAGSHLHLPGRFWGQCGGVQPGRQDAGHRRPGRQHLPSADR